MGFDDIPDWAIERAIIEVGAEFSVDKIRAPRLTGYGNAIMHFARYIAEHEHPPTDPVEDVFSDIFKGSDIGTLGGWHQFYVKFIEECSKRGIEIGKESK